LKEGRESLSPLFTLTQDFSLGVEPRFNEFGELAPLKLTLIEKGKLVNTLVSSRSSKEYGTPSNAAPQGESLRSPVIAGGTLPEADALKALGTGIYVSNFHYLNWSDPQAARITGMTRFACLWVENGTIVGPIKDMRFDESIYNFLGAELEAVTKEQHLIVNSETYEGRSLGGSLIPGFLVKNFKFTL
ncbi:MAG TPA: metallopeptidase TldD-related protein, partial [Spirochaetales bacterium]|nr:metallopeptidase TldD-related protein [Spirochaetales bacterium]HRV27371.1 metallopeptidase TldD-related protein [Spirochaetia bacterium]